MNGIATHSMWSDEESKDHLNLLDFKVAMLAIYIAKI